MTPSTADHFTDSQPVPPQRRRHETGPSPHWRQTPIGLLMDIEHRQLPLQVTEPVEIRRVSVLLATGLIEAEISALGPTARYSSAQVATVIRLTDAGIAQLAKMWDTRSRKDVGYRSS
jgi:hypothetical protein